MIRCGSMKNHLFGVWTNITRSSDFTCEFALIVKCSDMLDRRIREYDVVFLSEQWSCLPSP